MHFSCCARFVVLLLILISFNVGAETRLEIDYNTKADVVGLNASGVSLAAVLNQLAEELNFDIKLSDDLDRLVHLNMQGRPLAVLKKLIHPNNVVIVQDGLTPSRVVEVTLLPVGEKSREQRIRESIELPLLTDNEEDNARRIADYERRVQRRLSGLGRRKYN